MQVGNGTTTGKLVQPHNTCGRFEARDAPGNAVSESGDSIIGSQTHQRSANLAFCQRHLLSLKVGSTSRERWECLFALVGSLIVVARTRFVKKVRHSELHTSRKSSEFSIGRMDELATTSVRTVLIIAPVARMELISLVMLA